MWSSNTVGPPGALDTSLEQRKALDKGYRHLSIDKENRAYLLWAGPWPSVIPTRITRFDGGISHSRNTAAGFLMSAKVKWLKCGRVKQHCSFFLRGIRNPFWSWVTPIQAEVKVETKVTHIQ